MKSEPVRRFYVNNQWGSLYRSLILLYFYKFENMDECQLPNSTRTDERNWMDDIRYREKLYSIE